MADLFIHLYTKYNIYIDEYIFWNYKRSNRFHFQTDTTQTSQIENNNNLSEHHFFFDFSGKQPKKGEKDY